VLSGKVNTHTEGATAVVELDSLADNNALSVQLLDEFTAAVDSAEKNEGTRTILVRANGPVFCSGAALDEVARKGMSAIATRLVELQRRLSASPLPVVVAVEATVQAGGFGILGASDIVLAADDVQFQFTEVRNAVAPAAISLNILERVSPRWATELMLTGRQFTAYEAAEAGIITRAVPREGLHGEVSRVLSMLTEGSPQGLRETKKLLSARILANHGRDGVRLAGIGAALFNSDEAQRLLLG
jgi:enoyl-CoA hydratase/methylglutaconyl-CoA hydratase